MTPPDDATTLVKIEANRDEIIRRIWVERLRWSEAAASIQAHTKLWRTVLVLLAISGAILATAAASVDGTGTMQRVLAGVGACALGLTTLIPKWFLSEQQIDQWPRARSVSEGLKSEVYKFRAGVRPYDAPPTEDADPALRLLDRTANEIEVLGDDLLVYVPPEPARSSDPPPGPLGPRKYLESRVNDQIENFYRPKSRQNQRISKHFRILSICFAGGGFLLSTSMAFGVPAEFGAWVAVATTVAAAVAAHSAVNRYAFLATSYAKQASQLKRLARAWHARADRMAPDVWSDFVIECENAISAENRAWMSEMAKEVKGVDDVIRRLDPDP